MSVRTRKSGRARRGTKKRGAKSTEALALMSGLVISVLGKGYKVDINGELWICRSRGRIFAGKRRTKPVVGDRVRVEPAGEPLVGIIAAIEERHSVLMRRAPDRSHEQILVSNVDQVLICVTPKDPPFRPGLVDRYLVSCEAMSLQAVILWNKSDLVSSDELAAMVEPFEALGYPTLSTSAKTGEGVEALKERLCGAQSVFTGPSGVGKSSLANCIQPGISLRTGTVNESTGKGRHTTTVTSLLSLAGGYVMDTPGIREFSLWGIPSAELAQHFVEFRPFLSDCKFRDCVHVSEPQCGLKEALKRGDVTNRRYESYVQIREELLEQEQENSY